jgi:hypothetical protein
MVLWRCTILTSQASGFGKYVGMLLDVMMAIA